MWEVKVEKETLRRVEETVSDGGKIRERRASMAQIRIDHVGSQLLESSIVTHRWDRPACDSPDQVHDKIRHRDLSSEYTI
jgi:hypothetical protein